MRSSAGVISSVPAMASCRSRSVYAQASPPIRGTHISDLGVATVHRHTRRRPATRQTMRQIYHKTPRARLHKAIATCRCPRPSALAPRAGLRASEGRVSGHAAKAPIS
eukprot:316122-Prymnesium_polylepis.1